jgi:RNA-directed DNA polymerase
MMDFLKLRIADPNLLRIIGRFLKGGYMEEGKKYKTDKGTPQGGVILRY